ncbi:uncharacterized protein LOC108838937 [Raphanus sativus]|uniref:Uncharacterized protein LOC108838937 n=1 Tax=Raphanus sativus TaxID=3726 RepID=A0A6J0M5C0_RAPSA|nr:uncharacterized protein LOC108838937 [Raphanus sativus]
MAADDYLQIREELMGAGDELILLRYLKPMIENGASWPQHFSEDADVFNKNPSNTFNPEDTVFVIVNPRTEACGKTDGCDYGSWRIMARDKLIKNEETGELLGFKKILKFCVKKTTRAREYKRSWVMEEYRLPSKWNPNQDHVICKIRLLFQTEIGFLLSKHFSYSSGPLPATQSLPAYGYGLPQEEEGRYYLQNLIGHENEWPSYVTNDVYRMHPSALVDPRRDQMFAESGLCIFANRTEASGYTDGGCDRGCWRIVVGDKPISSITVMDETFGYRRVFKFCEEDDKDKHFYTDPNGGVVLLNWIMEEYRLAEEDMKNKVLCVIKLRR